MSDFVSLSCPTCGGRLKITNDIDRFACQHCGNEHVVKRGDGIVSLAPVVQGLKNVQTGVDKTVAELALRRLQGELGEVTATINGYSGSLSANRQAISDLQKKIRCSVLGQIVSTGILGLLAIGLGGQSLATIRSYNNAELWIIILFVAFGCILLLSIIFPLERRAQKQRISQIEQEYINLSENLNRLNGRKESIEQEIGRNKQIVSQS